MKSQLVRITLYSLLTLGILISCKKVTPPDSGKADDFLRSTPEAQGVATEVILRFMENVTERELELHSFMMLRHGKVISEAWWHPYRRDITHVMYSMSKTVTATAIGFAVQEGLLTVDDKVLSFFQRDLPEGMSDNLQNLTVKHLLSMSVGQERPQAFNAEDMNWAKTFLATPVQNEPGSTFLYNNYATYMLSAIIQQVTGETTMDYLTPRLFKPLGIENIKWEVNPEGVNTGGWGLQLKTTDMAKIGQFYLQKGQWNGQQLLNESWIEDATTAQIYQRPDRTKEENANDDGAQGYGYQLWLCTHDAYRMDGARGQLVVIIPDKDVVIVTTANVSHSHVILDLIWEYLYPAIFSDKQKSDEMTTEMYGDYVSSLELTRPFLTPDELSPRKDKKQTYRMESNALDIKEITFDYQSDGDCVFTLTKNNESFDFLIGWDRWRYGETDMAGPYFVERNRIADGLAPFTICGYGSWLTESDLSLRLLYMTESQYNNYSCHFAGDDVTVKVSNSLQRDVEPMELKGSLSQ